MQKKLLNSILILSLGMLIIVNIGCDKKTDCCTIIDTDVQILYRNELGENLINSTTDFEETNIKVYYKNGNEFEYIYKGNLDLPNMHRIDEDENGNLILTIFPSNYYESNQSTTLIELNQNVVDILVCEFELGSNREICKRAWLNGIEMVNRFIEIEK
ncbi:MAG: hypothetical protein H6566_14250 [Lewinellaceae bacterium]|nr:hypothetical protein [Lewinellaceae bacterium]